MISLTYLSFLFPSYNKFDLLKSLDKSNITIKSITNHSLKCYGKIKLYFKLPNFPDIKFEDFHVTDSIAGASPFIVNANTLKSFSLLLDLDANPPVFISKFNNNQLHVLYLNDTQRNYCYSNKEIIRPRETKLIYFKVPAVSHYLPGTSLLLSQDTVPYSEHKQLKLIPSVSNLTLENNHFIVKGYVQNLGFKTYSGIIKGSIQLADNYKYTNIPDDHQRILSIINEFQQQNIQIYNECRPPFQTEFSTKAICFHNAINTTQNTTYHSYNMNIHFPKHSMHLANPTCINNDTTVPNKSLTEERVNVSEIPIPTHELPKYYDPKQTIQLGLQSNCVITPTDLLPKGIDIPETLLATAKDIVLPENFDPQIWPYVQDIFINKYPQVVSLHSLDRGNISQTVGFYTIKLRNNVTLPKFKKIYYENSANSTLLKEVLEFLCKTNVISKASVEGGDLPSFSSPCFLVPRKDKRNQSARLVVDFRAINECIAIEPCAISNFDMLLNSMRDAVIFTTLDLKSAFQSIELSEDSKKLTQFSCMFGSYTFNTLCTGMATSPTALSRFVDVMIHHVPKFVNNKLIFNKNGLPIMEPNKLDNVLIYYDDILIFSLPHETYQDTIKHHFKLIEIVVSRLSYHNAKLDMTKACIAKANINFLGWLIGNSFCQADPKRINKIVDMPFPKSVTGMRSFLGSLNFLRNALNFQIIRNLHYLTPLTSSKLVKYDPSKFQLEKFEEIKKSLTQGPLYSKIILKGVPKILLTDSASEQYSQFGCILGQLIPARRPVTVVPSCLNLDDSAHQIIYDSKLPVRPIPPLLPEMDSKIYMSNLKLNLPPEHSYLLEDTLGFGHHVSNSLGFTIQTMLKAYNSSTIYKSLCSDLATYIKEHVAYHQILDHDFNSDKSRMKSYLENVKKGELYIDKHLHILQGLAQLLQRTFTIINTTALHDSNKLISFNTGKQKVPFFLLLYEKNDMLITRPSLVDKHSSYNLAQHSGSFEIVLYFSKTIPEQLKHQHIMNLELFALVESLKAVEKLISHDEVICCVDNKALYYAFHSKVVSSRKNVSNWGPTLGLNFPNITLAFVKTDENPSDFLTRVFHVNKSNIKSTKLPYYIDSIIDQEMPTDLLIPLSDWINWVKDNPQYLVQKQLPNKRDNVMISNVNFYFTSMNDIIKKGINQYEANLPINIRLQRLAYGDLSMQEITYPPFIHINPEIDTSINLLTPSNKRYSPRTTVDHPQNHQLLAAIHANVLQDKVNHIQLNTEKPPRKALGSALSRDMAFKNASLIFDPIRALEKSIILDTLMELQKSQYLDLYNECSSTFEKLIVQNKTEYSLSQGLLYIKKENSCKKLLLPDTLVNKYVALSHLICNHGGPKKMILNLTNYYHENLQKLCYRFCNTCLACLLVNHPVRSQHLGVFPLTSDVGEILHLDLMETLNTSSGFSHLLMVKCVISHFALVIPMYQKSSLEFLHIFVNNIWPLFHPKAIYTDNGSLFVSKKSLRTLTLLGTRIIYSSAFTGASHGGIESYVKLFKRIFKKVLTTEKTFNWTLLPALIAHLHNTTKNAVTGFSPYELLFGPGTHLSTSFLDLPLPKLHPSVKNEKEGIQNLHKNLQHILLEARSGLIKERDNRLQKKNQNKIKKNFNAGDVVLVKDQSKILGTTQPLKPYYLNSPYLIIHVRPTSVILKRLSDHLIICRSKNDVKKYTPLDETFHNLPDIVKKICQQPNFNLSSTDLTDLLNVENFNFENFSAAEDLDLESREFLSTFENPPPDPNINDSDLEQELLDDENFDFRITRQNKPSILKQMRNDYSEHKSPKKLQFFLPKEQ